MSEEEVVEAVETPAPVETPEASAPEAATLEAGSTENLFSGAPSEAAAAEPVFEPVLRGKLDKFGVAMGTGRRKTSVARVRIKPGSGQFSINGRTLEDFCCVEKHRETVMAPLKAADVVGKYDIWVRVEGGGITGQAGAMLLGISRALEVLNPSLHHMLSDGGFLTRDGRKVERKKYGFKKARRSFQFSKR
ncbi:MAG: 30S ribosomal protein S9 [Planctomycetota bacterium]